MLELKHLAPYLPYGLSMHYEGKTALLIGLHEDEYSDFFLFELCYEDGQELWQKDCFKPLLRQLSDLTKKIQIGEFYCSFIEHLSREYPNCPNFEFLFNFLHIASDRNQNKKALIMTNIEYVIINKLLEWHFDVFGLIGEGLAIDLNTVKG